MLFLEFFFIYLVENQNNIGMWISPDPHRQFASPYAYGSNPVNGVDPNGKDFGIIIQHEGAGCNPPI